MSARSLDRHGSLISGKVSKPPATTLNLQEFVIRYASNPQAPGPWLAVDTATDACSVALETPTGIAGRFEIAPRGHAGRLLQMLDETMAAAGMQANDLAAVVWCHGPGAFTGVRVAAGVTQGIAWAHALPVIGVSTLATVAQGAARRHGVTAVRVAMDARMGEVYWGDYVRDPQSGLMVTVTGDRLDAPGSLPVWDNGREWLGAGTGWGAYADSLTAAGTPTQGAEPEALPDARDSLPLAHAAWDAGRAVDAAAVAPVYLRDRVTG